MTSLIRPLLAALGAERRRELAGVQYLRGLAALMVVLYHSSAMMAEPKYFGRHPFARVLEGGGVGVDVFFVLSGFIIAYVALDGRLRPKLSAQLFYRRRFARIVPIMWIVVAAYAGLRLADRGTFPGWSYLRSLVLLWPLGAVEPNQIWTLRYEAWFYILFGLSFLAGARWLFALWLAAPLALALTPLAGAGADGPTGWAGALQFFASPVNLLFGLGGLVGAIFVRTGAAWRPLRAAPLALAALAVAVYGLSDLWSYDRRGVGEVLAIGVASAIAVALACTAPRPAGIFGRFGLLLGDASYATYLIHTMAISAWLGLAAHYVPGAPDLLVVGVSVLAALIGGVLVHVYVEPWAHDAGRWITGMKRGEGRHAPAALALASGEQPRG